MNTGSWRDELELGLKGQKAVGWVQREVGTSRNGAVSRGRDKNVLGLPDETEFPLGCEFQINKVLFSVQVCPAAQVCMRPIAWDILIQNIICCLYDSHLTGWPVFLFSESGNHSRELHVSGLA